MSPQLQHELELARLSTDLKRQTAQRSLATKTLEVLLVAKFVYEYGLPERPSHRGADRRGCHDRS